MAYQPCDLAIVYGMPNPLLGRKRGSIRQSVHENHKGPLLVVESSILGRVFLPPKGQFLQRLVGAYRKPEQKNPFYRLALNAAFGPTADFANKNSPSDRWERLGITIEPYRKAGDHVLLIGQTPNDASLRGIDIVDWLIDTARRIRKLSARPILVRFHPGMGDDNAIKAKNRLRKIADVHVTPRDQTLAENLKDAWVSVSLSSGAAIESLIAGVPAITLSPDSLAYGITPHDLKVIENPPTPKREQFLYDLAYAQWSPEEYADGTAWRHMESAVLSRMETCFASTHGTPLEIAQSAFTGSAA
ncbi:hypothetical protein L598_000100000830 [Mesorhizobium sp. J18]|nr:hypothetical protein L598_000100000830 [Mesorhizobium sp. J18]